MLRTVLPLLLLLLLAPPGIARESAAVTSAHAVASLVTDSDANSGAPFQAGLRLRLAPGWHTYWQNPGDAGVAPEIEVAAPAQAGPIAWPAPRRLSEGLVTTFGYTGDLVLPFRVQAPPGALSLRAHASWLVCERICVPEEGDFAIDLPAGRAVPAAEAGLFAAAAAASPVASPYPATVATDGTLLVQAPGLPVAQAAFFPAVAGTIAAGAPQPLRVAPDGFSLALQRGPIFDAAAPLRGVLVLTDAQGGETALNVTAPPGGVAASGLMEIVLLALAGGLLLNLMPCVFPVLAMKAMGLARMAADARDAVRAQAAWYTAGVMVAFVALGGALLAARAAGGAAGWGSQFQSPPFVAAMAWLLFAVGLNLSGVFAVGGGLAGVGQSLAGRRGGWGSFATGALAVLVATPCTAPFMAAAIAGALAAPGATTLLVFAAMGLGMALPYALLAAAPGLVRLLPRPGAWMEGLRQVLAFPMYAAAVWLLWVVSQQAGPDGVLATASGLLAVGFAAWAYGRSQTGSSGRRASLAAMALGLVAAATILPRITIAAPTAPRGNTQVFSPARLAALQAEGRPVFVNMTAAWCITCLVNERVALSTRAVEQAFARRGIATLTGDWTRQDPAVTAFLRQHGRDGVPLYVFYAPGAAPVVLPQILSEATLLAIAGG